MPDPGAAAAALTGGQAVKAARLRFLDDWSIQREGHIAPGGKLIIDYAISRLPDLRRTRREAELWAIEALIRFPSNPEVRRGSLLGEVRAGPNGPVVGHYPQPLEIDVPAEATVVEMWFHTYDALYGGADAWDSDFGRNYWFDVEPSAGRSPG